MKQLAKEIINGRRLGREDDLSIFLTANIDDLCLGADMIRKNLCGDEAELCSIINGRSGRCSEDCKFCAQSCHYVTEAESYAFRRLEEIVKETRKNEEIGIRRFSIVTAGRSLDGEDLKKALNVYAYLHRESNMELCASHGLVTEDVFRQLKAVGVTRYHSNIETSRRYFPHVCTTHTYDDKIANIQRAQRAGLEVCSGGIIGMGEQWEDRIDMAISLAELGIASIPLNILRPIHGTPFEMQPPISNEDILRTVAIFRYINPTAQIRIAAGRDQVGDGGRVLFRSGANAAISGDMLTTIGSTMTDDVTMLLQLGYKLQKGENK